MKKRVLLTILDGFGINPNKSADGNAIQLANTKYLDKLYQTYAHSTLQTSGKAVGLPDGQMGNSEVGHMNIGSGRIIYSSIEKINKDFDTNNFETLINFQSFMQKIKNNRLHLFILLSDGGVHSSIHHLYYLLTLLSIKYSNLKVYIHAFLDGRDTPPQSGIQYISQLNNKIEKLKPKINISLTSIIGRYYVMDRDKRWERIEKAYLLLTEGKGTFSNIYNIEALIQEFYNNNITDEFMEPIILNDEGLIQQNDSIFFLNFRSDRARQISRVFIDPQFNEFPKKDIDISFLSMTEYHKNFSNLSVYQNTTYINILAEILSKKSKKQIRIAETEKYAHVTFFFNCGIEEPFVNEERILIPSPKVKTYDHQPEMSAFKVAEKVYHVIEDENIDCIIVNFANADMVGHTGNLQATIKSIETLDKCLQKITQQALKYNVDCLITADHGNSEQMLTEDNLNPFTQHTTFPVPLILVSQTHSLDNTTLLDGILADIAPTILYLLDIDPLTEAPEMTGKILIQQN